MSESTKNVPNKGVTISKFSHLRSVKVSKNCMKETRTYIHKQIKEWRAWVAFMEEHGMEEDDLTVPVRLYSLRGIMEQTHDFLATLDILWEQENETSTKVQDIHSGESEDS